MKTDHAERDRLKLAANWTALDEAALYIESNQAGFFSIVRSDVAYQQERERMSREHSEKMSFFRRRHATAIAAGDLIAIRELGAKNQFLVDNPPRHPLLRQTSHPLEDLREVLKTVDPAVNTYLSQAVFSRRNRQARNLLRIKVCFADLDTYKTDIGHLPPESQSELVAIACRDLSLPTPSLIVSSGRGLHVKWVLDTSIPAPALPRWKAIQEYLGRAFEKFGADAQARDCSRVLRLVGTVNEKNGKTASVVWVNWDHAVNGVTTYGFEYLAEAVLPLSREAIQMSRQRKMSATASRDAVKDRPIRQNHAKAGPYWKNLWADRLADMRCLVVMRGWEAGIPSGHRNAFMFIAATALTHLVNVADFMPSAVALARVWAPTWSVHDLQNCISAIRSRMNDAHAGRNAEHDGRSVTVLYRFSNAEIINRLSVNEVEQTQMKTLIGSAEKLRRDKQRKAHNRAQAGILTTAERCADRASRRKAVLALRAKGSTFKEISARLEMSVKTAQNLAYR